MTAAEALENEWLAEEPASYVDKGEDMCSKGHKMNILYASPYSGLTCEKCQKPISVEQ